MRNDDLKKIEEAVELLYSIFCGDNQKQDHTDDDNKKTYDILCDFFDSDVVGIVSNEKCRSEKMFIDGYFEINQSGKTITVKLKYQNQSYIIFYANEQIIEKRSSLYKSGKWDESFNKMVNRLKNNVNALELAKAMKSTKEDQEMKDFFNSLF